MVNSETGKYRYFKPHHNQELFQRPIYVSNRRHLNRLYLRMRQLNITDYILRQRPDTKWKPYLITNLRIVIYSLNFVLGKGDTVLPDRSKAKKKIYKKSYRNMHIYLNFFGHKYVIMT